MNEEIAPSQTGLIIWALALIVAWGAYFYVTKVMGIDFDSIRQARLSG